MNEFQIYELANLNFINNAIYLLCVIIMTVLAFYGRSKRSMAQRALARAAAAQGLLAKIPAVPGCQCGQGLKTSLAC